MEVWKDVVGYEGLYQVSNYGNVRSIDRYVSGRWGKQLRKGKMLSQRKRCKTDHYLSVPLWKENKLSQKMVHRLVADAFLGNQPEKQINHKDENPENNRLDNLEWVTPYENMHYNDLIDRINHRNKRKICGFDMRGNLVYSFDSIAEAEEHGFNRYAISQNINGRTQSSGGYVWKLAE